MLSRHVDGKCAVLIQDGVVEAWSTVRLPFEPTGWLRDLRAELQAALRTLVAEPGELLHAVYSAAPGAACDVENVLLYNVGSAALCSAMTSGVRLERAYSPPPAPIPLETSDELHFHRYALARPGEAFAHWTQGAELPCLHHVRFRSPRIEQVWSAVRRQVPPLEAAQAPPQRFGLRFAVTPPGRTQGLSADAVKVLIDGVVSALHAYEGAQLDEVASRLSARGLGTAAQIAAQLTDARWALLGPREVIRPYRQSSVQWNPADDLCLAAEVVMDPQPTAHGEWELSGTVFGLP